MASVALETSALKINASNIKSNLISSNKKIAKLRVQKIKLIDTIQKESIRKRVEKKIESPIKGITPVLGGAFSKLAGMMRPIKDKFLDIFGTLLLAFAIDKLPKIIQTLTSAYEKVKPVWTVATKTLRTIFDGIVSLKPFADKVYNFSKNTFQDISNKTKQLTGIELEIDDDLKVFDDFFGEPKDDGLEPPKQEQEKNIFNGFSGLFSRSTQNKKDQNKNKIKTQTSDKRTELTQVAIDYQKILKGYVRKGSTAETSTQSPTPRTTTPAPAPTTTVSGGGWRPLLELIAEKEAVGGSYDSIYPSRIKHGLSKMTIAEADAWQARTANSRGSAAAGRYQFMYIKDQARAAGIGPNEIFNAANQDKMAIALITKKRKITMDMIKNNPNEAMIRLGMEFASFPMPVNMQGHSRYVYAGQSYYAGDGLNKAGVSVHRVQTLFKSLTGSANVTPIRQNRSIQQLSRNSGGGNRTLIVPFGIETLVPMFQGVSESEVNSTTQRRLQRRANNLP